VTAWAVALEVVALQAVPTETPSIATESEPLAELVMQYVLTVSYGIALVNVATAPFERCTSEEPARLAT
jgi:hypothetical protein